MITLSNDEVRLVLGWVWSVKKNSSCALSDEESALHKKLYAAYRDVTSAAARQEPATEKSTQN